MTSIYATPTRLLRKLLVTFPGLIKGLNRLLPKAALRRLRTAAEKIKYADVSEVHELPQIFHYWSEKNIRPMLAKLGYKSLEDFFIQHILCFSDKPQIRLLSIGAGNCELDLLLVAQLKAQGLSNLRYECLEINATMLGRASARAGELGIAELMVFTEQDINKWRPQEQAGHQVIICRQFLHHVVELEELMLNIKRAMAPRAKLLVDDMIGRNGHMRWPEALSMVEELWQELPAQYKYHHLHGVTHKKYKNWDCSITGYEGIRAQDILPLLLEHFHFDTFIAFSNIIDVFVDRPYGPNFSVDDADDLKFIDRVQAMDKAAIEAGKITPTHLIAAMQVEPVETTLCYNNLTPEVALRHTQ